MAAITTKVNRPKKNEGGLTAVPVAASQYIYCGGLAVVEADGYLYDLTAAIAAEGGTRIVGIVDDESENRNATAPSANGSISGTDEQASGLSNGEKTVRKIFTTGDYYTDSISGLTQANVGDTIYATNNNDFNATGDGLAVGIITAYISSTSCWFSLNCFRSNGDVLLQRGLITAATTTTGGDAISWSPGVAIYLNNVGLDVTTAATGVATMDVGIAANGTTTSDTLIDGIDVGTAAIYSTALMQHIAATGNAAGQQKMTATQFITGTPSATLAGLVGVWWAEYIKA